MNNKFYAQAEVLVEIIRQGSITAAAVELRLSKSNVSQKLAEMETDLDVILFQRNTRSLELTSAGTRVYDLCVTAVDSLKRAHSEVRHQLRHKEPQGAVTISGSNLYLTEFVLPLLPALRTHFPKVRIDLVGGDQAVNQRSETVDLRLRVGSVDPDGVNIHPLAPLERVLCATSTCLSAMPDIDHPASLAKIPIILRDQEDPKWTFRRGPKSVTYLVTAPDMIVNTYELCLGAVRSNLGVAILARAVVTGDMEAGTITNLLPDWTIPPIPVSLVVPLSRYHRPEVRVVTQYLAERLG